MKRFLTLLCALFLCANLLAACSANEAPQQSAEPTDSGPSAPSDSEQNTAPPTANGPAASDATYFVIGGILAGSWENGAWRSLNGTDGSYEESSSNDFYFKDVLKSPRFALYSRKGSVGYSEFALVNGGEGVSGFEDGDKTELFAPYAKPDPGDVWPFSMEIRLPAAFGPEMDGVKIPHYGYALRFSYDTVDLATNSPDDLNAYGTVDWGSYWSEEWGVALKSLLEKYKIYGEPHIDDSAAVDIDGDGEREMLLFANTPKDENGHLKISPEDGGSYSVILLRRADGSYETVYERYCQYTSDVTVQFSLHPLGIFDLNGDGRYEICANMVQWESGYTFVLSQNENGSWATVLRANWGT